MHNSSYICAETLLTRYTNISKDTVVLDVGSLDVNGSYRNLFLNCKYIGLDQCSGKNVNITAKDPYVWPVENESIDIVISGQTFEHMKFPWKAMEEIFRVLKYNGFLILIAPSNGPIHRYPVDCWRIFPDGLCSLAEYVNMEVVETGMNDITPWKDSFLVAKK